jgi:hypothetical protein
MKSFVESDWATPENNNTCNYIISYGFFALQAFTPILERNSFSTHNGEMGIIRAASKCWRHTQLPN